MAVDRPPRVAKNNAPNYNINQLSKDSVMKEPKAKALPKKPAPKAPAVPKANTGRHRRPAAGGVKKTQGRPRPAVATESAPNSASKSSLSSEPTSADLKKMGDDLGMEPKTKSKPKSKATKKPKAKPAPERESSEDEILLSSHPHTAELKKTGRELAVERKKDAAEKKRKATAGRKKKADAKKEKKGKGKTATATTAARGVAIGKVTKTKYLKR